jgi:hypothetical protein
MIKSLAVEVDHKYLNSSVYAQSAPPLTGTLVNPTLPSQGVSNGQRTGDSIFIDKLECRLFINNTTGSDVLRLVCLQARAGTILTTNYSTIPTTGIFDLDANGNIGLTSFINYKARNETFHVIFDKEFRSSLNSLNGAQTFEMDVPLKVREINFTPGSTASLDGGIFWVALSRGDLVLDMEQRLVYHDI